MINDDVVSNSRSAAMSALISPMDDVASSLESPIEAAMFWALIAEGERAGAGLPLSLGHFLPLLTALAAAKKRGIELDTPEPAEALTNPDKTSKEIEQDFIVSTLEGYHLRIVPQQPVAAGGKNYRIDFAVTVVGHRILDLSGDSVSVAVECDGHDYHERTKEQAARDKERDRNLQAVGWQVARFTGSEIYRSPREVAKKVIDFVHTLMLEMRIKRLSSKKAG
jgi:very-short-patch-repair endonuclease